MTWSRSGVPSDPGIRSVPTITGRRTCRRGGRRAALRPGGGKVPRAVARQATGTMSDGCEGCFCRRPIVVGLDLDDLAIADAVEVENLVSSQPISGIRPADAKATQDARRSSLRLHDVAADSFGEQALEGGDHITPAATLVGRVVVPPPGIVREQRAERHDVARFEGVRDLRRHPAEGFAGRERAAAAALVAARGDTNAALHRAPAVRADRRHVSDRTAVPASGRLPASRAVGQDLPAAASAAFDPLVWKYHRGYTGRDFHVTGGHEREAKAAQRAREPSRPGVLVLRILGLRRVPKAAVPIPRASPSHERRHKP